MLSDNWLVFEDDDNLSRKLANAILKIAAQSIELRDKFTIVLAGGRSPIKLYKILSQANSNWEKWHIYMGDERCLPLRDMDRNDRVINDIWLNDSPIPKCNIHLINAELGMFESQLNYKHIVKEINKFDVTLLCIGEDGHTASLFPGHQYPKAESVVLEFNSPKLPKERISLSYQRLNNSRHVFKIISGKSKQKAVKFWLQGEMLPINNISGDFEQVYINQNALP